MPGLTKKKEKSAVGGGFLMGGDRPHLGRQVEKLQDARRRVICAVKRVERVKARFLVCFPSSFRGGPRF